MRVIITGGTGLIGRSLTDSLVQDGHEIVVLSRNPGRVRPVPSGVRLEQWDGRTADGWGHWADGAGAIVNLAGESIASGRWTAERKRRLRDSRLNAGTAVVQAIEMAVVKPPVLIQSSGVGYYGFHKDEKLTETDPPGTDFLARLAVEWETVTEPVEALGVRRAVIRTGGVLTMAGGALPPMVLPFKMFVGGPLGSGKQWLSWIHMMDQIRAIRFLIDHGSASGAFNLVSPGAVTQADFGRTLAKVMNRPYYMPAPAFAIRLALGELSGIVLEGQRALPARLTEAGFTFHFTDSESALRDLLGNGMGK